MNAEERLLQVLIGPHVSEKTTRTQEQGNAFTFRVANFATKPEIKKAVEVLFKTKVESVRIVNVKAKKKAFRGVLGIRKKWKKAYVTLSEGQRLDLLQEGQ